MLTGKRIRTALLLRIFFGILGVVSLITGVVAWQQLDSSEVIIEWTTASELDTAGFNLYRADTPEGPFELVNTSLIPSSDDPLSGGDYAYKDANVQAGNTYYYLLEDVEYSGQTSRTEPTEVVASGSSIWELVLAVLLFLISVYGLITTRSRSRMVDVAETGSEGFSYHE